MNIDANIWTRDNSCSYPNFPIVDTLIDNMTIEQKVGQIIQPDLGSITLEEIQENQLGFVLNGGDTAPCLLYTSPSPRDLSTSRMPSSA